MPERSPTPLGEEWSDEALLATASEFPGVGGDADLNETDRFRAAVSRLVAKSRERVPDERGICVFLLEPTPPAAVAGQCYRVPMLDRGREVLDSRIWFVPHVVTTGFWLSAEFPSDDEFFNHVTSTLALGGVPAIVFDPRDPGPELRFYPNGLDDLASIEPLAIAYTPIRLEDLAERIDLIHRMVLVTPRMQPRGARVWIDAGHRVPADNAEDVLSALLSVGLQTAFPTCKVRVEQSQATGRLDIEIEERVPEPPGAVRRYAILELKVLRARTSNGTTVPDRKTKRWVKDGVTQAAAYRTDREAEAAALCCFDMRGPFTGRQCFAHVLEEAEAVAVELYVWHLFSSAAAYRRYLKSIGALVAVAG